MLDIVMLCTCGNTSGAIYLHGIQDWALPRYLWGSRRLIGWALEQFELDSRAGTSFPSSIL